MNEIKKLFSIREDICFLNFGSFGAVPKEVQAVYQNFQNEAEEDPVYFITRKGIEYLEMSKQALAAFIHCSQRDLIFVTNPSYAVNLVAKNFKLNLGDEVLSTSIEYGACDRIWQYYCDQAGAHYRRQNIEFPIESKSEFVEQFWKGVSTKTKLIFISHVTSSTALILPVNEIAQRAHAMGIPIFIDGAHVPGHIPLNIQEIRPTYYTGACHKWMMTPRGNSFLYVDPNYQLELDPLIISWGYKAFSPSNSQFQDYHQMNGTRDFTAFLMIPAVLAFMIKNQWDQVASASRELVRNNANRLNQITGSRTIVPISEDFIGQMYASKIHIENPESFQIKLYDTHRIQIPLIRQDDNVYIRYSIQGFNDQEDLNRLFEVLSAELQVK